MTSPLGLYILEEITFLKEQATANKPIQLHCSSFCLFIFIFLISGAGKEKIKGLFFCNTKTPVD